MRMFDALWQQPEPGPPALQLEKILDTAECPLCFELLYEPHTTLCGHSFCRRCLAKAMQHSTKCPTCRTVLAGSTKARGSGSLPVTNSTLHSLLQQLAPSKYAARAEVVAQSHVEVNDGESQPTLRLFILDHVLPRQRLKLHVYEPRYRRLMAATLASRTPTFGVVGWQASAPGQRALAPVATECEVLNSALLADGRYLCEVVGVRRCRLLRDWEEDEGYRRAAIEALVDDPVDDHARLESLCADVAAQVGVWIDRVRVGGWERSRHQLNTILAELGPIPQLDDAESFSLWVGALINPIPALGVAPEIRLDILVQTSTLERLNTLNLALRRSINHMAICQYGPGGDVAGFAATVTSQLGTLARLIILVFARFIALPLSIVARLFAAAPRLDVPLQGIGQ